MQETWVQSLRREDPLEEGMATHSSILAWRTPWTEEPGGLQSLGLQRVGHNQSNLAYKNESSFRSAFYIPQAKQSGTRENTQYLTAWFFTPHWPSPECSSAN